MWRLAPLLLLGAACGGGSDATPLPTAEVLAVTTPLPAAGGVEFAVTGTSLPGGVGETVGVLFRAVEGNPFLGCTTDTLDAVGTIAEDGSVQGTAPVTGLAGPVDAYVTLDYGAGVELTSAAPIARFEGGMDPAIDQDLDGVHDRCDPKTYDFEDDVPGVRPSGMTQLDGLEPGFVVATMDGEQVARYDGAASTGLHDRFDRFRQDLPHQDVTAYIDYDSTPSLCSLEFWSEGSYAGNAGAGLILQVRSGLLYFFPRIWRNVPPVVGPALPASGRIRVRLRKEEGTRSTMYVDAWVSGAWTLDHAVFPIPDDRPFRGLDTAMADYGFGSRGVKRVTLVREPLAGALTIARAAHTVADWKLFQRDADDRAAIPLPVHYNASEPVVLQARVVSSETRSVLPGHGFADHRLDLPAATGGRASLELAGVPTGGNYDIEVLLTAADDGAVLAFDRVEEIAVGDLWLAIGQSNMAGYSGTLAGATTPISQAHLYGNDGRWKQATEPMDDGTDQLDAVSRESPQHSLMLPFAKYLYEQTGVPVGVIPAPKGGTYLYTQWQRKPDDPDHRATLYGSALHRALVQGGPPLRGILWYQGEGDAIAGRTTAQYREDLERLIAQYRADLSAPEAVFLCVQLGTWSAGRFPHWTNIQEAQRQVCRADALAALATVKDQPHSDGIHYAVAAAQELGMRLADQARVLVFGHAIDPLTELVDVVASPDGMAIELHYDAPVFGGAAALYAVADDTGTNAVIGVSASGSTVTLELTRALDAGALVRYGMATGSNVAWVEDAQGVPVPALADVAVR